MTQNEMVQNALTVEQTAATLGVSVRTVYRLARAGRLGPPSYARTGRRVSGSVRARRVFFDRAAVETLKRARFERLHGAV